MSIEEIAALLYEVLREAQIDEYEGEDLNDSRIEYALRAWETRNM